MFDIYNLQQNLSLKIQREPFRKCEDQGDIHHGANKGLQHEVGVGGQT